MASAKAVMEALRPQAESAFAELLVQPYAALAALPPTHATQFVDLSKKACLTIYRDVLPNDQLKIVVQLMVRGMLGSARIWAHGFFISPGEAPVRATDEQLYDFF